MNFRKLLTYFAFGTAAVMPFAGAQNPTILQGNYITNVFGNSNFVLNPNAQTNVANVTVSSATVTRSTTTPLVATSEFNITTSTSTGYADWSLRVFDEGMKNNNCEARFTYRGFSVGSTTAQILQGANVVAQLTLTASTDPRIASINFPCGDLSAVTKFRLQQASASLTGTNEIGGIYMGLATNMANVSQAENVVQASRATTTQTIPDSTSTDIIFNSESLDVYGEFDTSTGVFTAKRAGNYFISASYRTNYVSWTGGAHYAQIALVKNNTTTNVINYIMADANVTKSMFPQANAIVSLNVGDTLRVKALIVRGASTNLEPSSGETIVNIARFPSTSELVVTPERQNVFGGSYGFPVGSNAQVTSASWAKLTFGADYSTRNFFGKATAIATTDRDIKLTVDNMPVGNYQISVTGGFYTLSNVSGTSNECVFGIADSATGGAQIAGIQINSTGDVTKTDQATFNGTMQGIYKNISVGSRTFFVQAKLISTGGSCNVYSNSDKPVTITVTPLDQPSNSALYVQGPILASQTGAAIPANYVGETQTQTQASNVNLVASGSATTTSKTLQPGVWLILGTISINVSANGGAINCSLAGQTKSAFNVGGVVATTGNARLSFMTTVSISSATAYNYSCFSSSTVTGTISGSDQDTTWTAIRLN